MEIKDYIELKKNGELFYAVFPSRWDRNRFMSNFYSKGNVFFYGEYCVEFGKCYTKDEIISILNEFKKINGLEVRY